MSGESDLRCRLISYGLARLFTICDGMAGVLNRVCFWAWGVKLGRECRFSGVTSVRRAPGSTIVVGERCVFRSRTTGNRIGINRPCMLTSLYAGASIELGNRVGLSGAVIGAAESIVIEDDVLVGANATITDTDWHNVDPVRRRSRGACAAVRIKRNAWIGVNAIILKGVTIGENSVVGAGSVVTHSIPDNAICAGQPARVVRLFC